jgi:hypothetical protein
MALNLYNEVQRRLYILDFKMLSFNSIMKIHLLLPKIGVCFWNPKLHTLDGGS